MMEQEAAEGFQQSKALKQLPVLWAALAAIQEPSAGDTVLVPNAEAA